MNLPDCDLLLEDLALCTLDGADGYTPVADAAIAIHDGHIAWFGPRSQLPRGLAPQRRESLDGALLTPALVDCHTHLVFGGERAGEFEQRLGGASYEAIARAGGGIVSSVRATRAASEDALVESALDRARDLVADGVATLEVKSGYGLDTGTELKMLRAARRVGAALGIEVRTTFLGAHALPPEFAGRSDDYIDEVCDRMLPAVAAEGLADAVDAYCEGIGFSPEQTGRVFRAAQALGLPVKLHADQLSDLGGAALAAAHGALSADHVEFTSEAGVAAMARHGTVAVLLPGAFFCLRETRLPPVEAFRRHGVPMAVATDLNPGTSPLRSQRLALAMACVQFRLTPEEALRGASQVAAQALGLLDRGRLAVGLRADLAAWSVERPAELAYWVGGRLCRGVWSAGRRVA